MEGFRDSRLERSLSSLKSLDASASSERLCVEPADAAARVECIGFSKPYGLSLQVQVQEFTDFQ